MWATLINPMNLFKTAEVAYPINVLSRISYRTVYLYPWWIIKPSRRSLKVLALPPRVEMKLTLLRPACADSARLCWMKEWNVRRYVTSLGFSGIPHLEVLRVQAPNTPLPSEGENPTGRSTRLQKREAGRYPNNRYIQKV